MKHGEYEGTFFEREHSLSTVHHRGNLVNQEKEAKTHVPQKEKANLMSHCTETVSCEQREDVSSVATKSIL